MVTKVTGREVPMIESAESTPEVLVRFSRRSMKTLLGIVLVLGLTALDMTLRPGGTASRFMARASYLVPLAIVIVGFALRATLRGRRFDPRSPEAKAVLNDELRQMSLNRAARAALIVLVAAQLPLGLALGGFGSLPPIRTALAMAEASITLGMATFIALFLVGDRE
jgi:hypothetical protein